MVQLSEHIYHLLYAENKNLAIEVKARKIRKLTLPSRFKKLTSGHSCYRKSWIASVSGVSA